MDATSVEAVIFDLDNTLLDREALFLRVWRKPSTTSIPRRDSDSTTRDEALELMVLWDEDGYGVRQAMRRRWWLSQWPDTGLDDESLADVVRRRRWTASWRPDAEVNAMLAELNERGMPWGIVTNGGYETGSAASAEGRASTGSRRSSSSPKRSAMRNPTREYSGDALRAAGLTASERTLFVGDTPTADIDGAKRFGMQAAWVTRGRDYPADLLPPDHVIDLVTEVRSVLGL